MLWPEGSAGIRTIVPLTGIRKAIDEIDKFVRRGDCGYEV